MSSSTSVVVKSGQIVRFPVASNDPLAQYQQMKTVAELGDLHGLSVVRALVAAKPGSSTADITGAVNGILASAGTSQATVITIPVDFHVEVGGSVVFAGPVTTIEAQNVYIDGQMFVYGNLTLTCNALGASPGGGSRPGTPGGGVPLPGPPPKAGPIKFQ
jgi:hypothetical protein